ncbi:uncharacterized protein LOC143078119 [Mytilus galloprovincialis]|uniref:uncharacterized protein LOC143078119 n=1 Tax=Mytilus galloprovincialis TaxID=29158 RepID=UPI003F7B8EC9
MDEQGNMSKERNQELGAQDIVEKKQDVVGKKLATHKCSIHTSNDISIFCRQCNKLICPSCLTQEHQQHVMCDIETIHNEKLGILTDKNHIITNEFVPFFTEENSKLDKILVTHQKHCEKMKLNIMEQDRKLKEEITKKTSALLQTFENELQTTNEEIKKRKSELEDQLSILNYKHETIDQIQESDDIQKICETADAMLKHVNEVNISSASLPRKNQEYKEGNINTETISSLIGLLQPITLPDTAKVQFKVIQTYVTDLNAIGKVTSGEKTWIKNSTSSVLRKIDLSDELLVIGETSNIKVRNMAVNKSGDLFLAFDNSPRIKMVKNGEKEMNDFHQFPIPWIDKPQVPVALHCYKDDQLIAGTVEKGTSMDTVPHNVKRQIVWLSKDKQVYEYDQDGRRLFMYPHRITSDTEGNIIILDKFSNKSGRIISMTTEGTIKWTYNGPNDTIPNQLFDPWDIIVTSHNNVIICDMRNNALHVLNFDGQIMTCQKTDSLDIKYPASMDVNKKGHLILGCGTEYEQKAKLHTLEFKGC